MAIKDVRELLPVPLKKTVEKAYKPKRPPVIRSGQKVYPSGYPLSTTVLQLLDDMVERLEDNFPAALIIEGGQGLGKTTLATLCGDYIQGEPLNIDVDSPDKQVAYPGNYIGALDHMYVKGRKVLILDECSFLSGLNAGKKEVRNIVELWNTIRQYGIFVIMCLPQAHILYSPLIDQDVVRCLIRMDSRDKTESRFKWYDVHKMLKIRERQKKAFDPAAVYNTVFPTNTGVAKPLPKKDSEDLDKVSMAGKTEVRMQKLIAEKGYLDTTELAAQFGKSTRWVQIRIKERKIKPVMVQKNRRYYAPEIIDMIGRD